MRPSPGRSSTCSRRGMSTASPSAGSGGRMFTTCPTTASTRSRRRRTVEAATATSITSMLRAIQRVFRLLALAPGVQALARRAVVVSHGLQHVAVVVVAPVRAAVDVIRHLIWLVLGASQPHNSRPNEQQTNKSLKMARRTCAFPGGCHRKEEYEKAYYCTAHRCKVCAGVVRSENERYCTEHVRQHADRRN
ncbi:hypothetical protein B0H63DRAFT_289909 [Podospora didyma]|uniref:Uncharacterized protein n=1 Tax=Podospora didyma TaxID=330526 RepID=A0AAE0K958_9PEZI|nr:hypothetical protein B0H63DRAFT_289909 [Podospora didyma]